MHDATLAIIKETLDALGASYSDITLDTVAGQPVFSIVTDDSQTLIGTRGETLRALDHLIKKIAEAKGGERENFIVDVNDYQVKHIRDIEARAKMMAERARSFQYDVEMPPMSAYERLIVHSTLSEEPNVTTESQGEGRERRVVIKYTSEDTTPSPAEAL